VYDPLVHAIPGKGEAYPRSYWVETAGLAPPDDGPLTQHIDAEVAIIGGGYAGISCALHLKRNHGINAIVLEANKTAWGCSGRNGSFARVSGGRVPLAALCERFGPEVARRYFTEMQLALETVRTLIADGRIECDLQPDGVYKVACRPEHVEKLTREASIFQDIFRYPAYIKSREETLAVHKGSEAFGSLYLPDGFSMHPLKLAWGMQRMAREIGASIHTGSPVVEWNSGPAGHTLRTPGGVVNTRYVVSTTNGYTSPTLHRSLAGRVLPVHSQIIVTRPMRADEKANSLIGSECMFDTRNLLFYYRRLPDDRILFGGRSAIHGKDAENPLHRERLKTALYTKFPALGNIEIDYNWGGWVAVTQTSLPFICAIPGLEQAFTAGGYAGSGVSFSIHAGKRLAEMVTGVERPCGVDFLHEMPSRYPLQPFVRLGQRLAYAWYRAKDRR
jgi:gamma-glutamylputrescine oxidase